MKNSDHNKSIIIGIGNDSRQDDGLGWALLDKIEKIVSEDVELIKRYQLNIEDADLIKNAKSVLFVDACRDELEHGAEIIKCKPNGDITFTTHALSPSAILALCNQIYDSNPESYILKMQGYEWELQVGLTINGKKNLNTGCQLFNEFAHKN